MHTAYLLLGSNMGEREMLIQKARETMSKRCGVLAAASNVVETEPWGTFAEGENPQPFLNQVICIKTVLGAQKLMQICMEVEDLLGRVRDTEREGYLNRTMDIDILLFDQLSATLPKRGPLPEVIVPHPRLRERPFAMALLKEVMPDFE